MLHYTVETAQPETAGCVKCCCERLSLKPGTINRVSLGYAPWAVPIGRLNCVPQFSLEQMETCPPPVGTDLPPVLNAGDAARFDVIVNTPFNGDLNDVVEDPEGAPLTFKTLTVYQPQHGKVLVNPSGAFTFVPQQAYTGIDRFFASASDGVNPPFVFEVILGIGVTAASALATPHVSVDLKSVQVDQRYYTVVFPLKVSPAAATCEVWRMTVLQGALDCDCVCYTRSDCYDISIVKC